METWLLHFLPAVAALAAVFGVAMLVFYKVPRVRKIFKDIETLFIPAVQGLGSLVVGIMGLYDWGPLASAVNSVGFSVKQIVGLALVGLAKAAFDFLMRVNRASDVGS